MRTPSPCLLIALILAGCAGVGDPPGRPVATAEAHREIDPAEWRLDAQVCSARGPRDLQREHAEVAEATREVEAVHAARMLAFDQTPAQTLSEPKRDEFIALQHVYHRDRFQALYPLAERGNSAAIHGLSSQYRWVESGFTDLGEWLRLLTCASDLGNPSAGVELMQRYWHDKGDGSFADVQRNRSAALELAERGAEAGDQRGVGMLGVYIGAGRHQYPLSYDIGRRLLVLCAEAGDKSCRSSLIEAPELGRGYALRDPVEMYLLLEQAAADQPALFAGKRDAARARLSASELLAAQRRSDRWRPRSWAALKSEWLEIKREIIVGGCPASTTCKFAEVCSCPPT